MALYFDLRGHAWAQVPTGEMPSVCAYCHVWSNEPASDEPCRNPAKCGACGDPILPPRKVYAYHSDAIAFCVVCDRAGCRTLADRADEEGEDESGYEGWLGDADQYGEAT